MNEFLSEIGAWLATNPVHAAGIGAGAWLGWKVLKIVRAAVNGVIGLANGVAKWFGYRGQLRHLARAEKLAEAKIHAEKSLAELTYRRQQIQEKLASNDAQPTEETIKADGDWETYKAWVQEMLSRT